MSVSSYRNGVLSAAAQVGGVSMPSTNADASHISPQSVESNTPIPSTSSTHTIPGVYNVTQNNPILRDSEYGQPFARYYAHRLLSSSDEFRQGCGKALNYLNDHIHNMYAQGKLKGIVYGPVGMYMYTTTKCTAAAIHIAVSEYTLLRFVITDKDDRACLNHIFSRMGLDIDISAHHFPNMLVPLRPNSLGAVILAPMCIYNQIGHAGIGLLNQYFYDIMFGLLTVEDESIPNIIEETIRSRVLHQRFAVYPDARPLAFVQGGMPVKLYQCSCPVTPATTAGAWFEPSDFTITRLKPPDLDSLLVFTATQRATLVRKFFNPVTEETPSNSGTSSSSTHVAPVAANAVNTTSDEIVAHVSSAAAPAADTALTTFHNPNVAIQYGSSHAIDYAHNLMREHATPLKHCSEVLQFLNNSAHALYKVQSLKSFLYGPMMMYLRPSTEGAHDAIVNAIPEAIQLSFVATNKSDRDYLCYVHKVAGLKVNVALCNYVDEAVLSEHSICHAMNTTPTIVNILCKLVPTLASVEYIARSDVDANSADNGSGADSDSGSDYRGSDASSCTRESSEISDNESDDLMSCDDNEEVIFDTSVSLNSGSNHAGHGDIVQPANNSSARGSSGRKAIGSGARSSGKGAKKGKNSVKSGQTIVKKGAMNKVDKRNVTTKKAARLPVHALLSNCTINAPTDTTTPVASPARSGPSKYSTASATCTATAARVNDSTSSAVQSTSTRASSPGPSATSHYAADNTTCGSTSGSVSTSTSSCTTTIATAPNSTTTTITTTSTTTRVDSMLALCSELTATADADLLAQNVNPVVFKALVEAQAKLAMAMKEMLA